VWSRGSFVYLENGKPQPPLRYSTGKTQADVYEELRRQLDTYDVVIYRSQTGTGKTIVLLNLAREFGGATFTTITNVLSRQYHHDYERAVPGISIGFIMGRSNFECPYKPGLSCNNRNLPCTRRLEKKERRYEAGRECPYFVYFSSDSDVDGFDNQMVYTALNNSRYGYIHYNRRGCPFYEQYFAYVDKNVVSMNFSMFRIETALGRLPYKRLIVIDEGDEFLETLFLKTSITDRRMRQLEREGLSVAEVLSEQQNRKIQSIWDEVVTLYEEIKETEGIFSIRDSPFDEFLDRLVLYLRKIDTDRALSYRSRLLWLMKFSSAVAFVEEYEAYGTTAKRITFCVPEPGVVLTELLEKLGVGSGTKVVFCSATFQSDEVLRDMYGLDRYGTVIGEIRARGKVIPCVSLRNMVSIKHTNWERPGFREYFFSCFLKLMNKVERPAIVLVHSYKYLPPGVEVSDDEDVMRFKEGEIDMVVSTKIRRGVDFPNARGLLFQRYPFPDMQSPEMQILRSKLGSERFSRFYRDRALRDFIQGIGRCTRGENQTVRVYSPDLLCFDMLSRLTDIFDIGGEEVVQ